jgi:hypothetical protein
MDSMEIDRAYRNVHEQEIDGVSKVVMLYSVL